MSKPIERVLVVGATGRTGRHVVAEAAAHGITPVALARNGERARSLFPTTEIAVGDLEVPQSLIAAVENVDGVILAHGSDNEPGASALERIDYGGVRNILQALGDRSPRIVLMTTALITHRDHYYNDGGRALDWKRRSERLVRVSQSPYTIVRPGTLDSGPGGQHVVIEQGDIGRGGGIARDVLGRVLVEALLAETAIGKTLEVFSGPGEAAADWRRLFDGAAPDVHGAVDGAKDTANMPVESEPSRVRDDLESLRGH